MIRYANDLTFQSEILDSTVPTLVDFWADWCGPCRTMAPALDEVANKRPDVKVVKVSIDEAPEAAAKYGVRGIPTLMLFQAGKPVKTTVGAASAAKIEKMLP
ncbi:thioredoxin [Paraburkholderia sp. UCT31]|nr:thioredoxin [Paraburkholderia sp. UCT31]